MAKQFPRPQTATLTLIDGGTLTVKKRLTAGEETESSERMYKAMPDGSIRVMPALVDLAVVTAYLLDWNLAVYPDDPEPAPSLKGLKIEERESVLMNMDSVDYDEIVAAIKKHEKEVQAKRLAEKKSLAAPPEGEQTSSSPSGAAGASNGSETSTEKTTTSS